ncbi:Rieske 2Fe-2S domain-containing protein [Azoarcus sp. TTM-91]|uniref:Rieske (2Fe-2S) protein n=1 Tax=Azoarcus sp. TTM-91 TaxID=2691581 RepID=UPI00145D4D17|nr:Rieske 2Fe-2S domain-containing protein [Azoarcus sp. TTM-91]NMG34083.1 Rieske 2Fe-2S domain-containing protein [Azoarcus sp. TTM-91]
MAERERLICLSSQLLEGGDGVRFLVGQEAAFAVRYSGVVYGYLNRCAHVPVELDWLEGKFFDLTGHYLLCAVHGAHYEPRTGFCVMGPCKGGRLPRLTMRERGGEVFVVEEFA